MRWDLVFSYKWFKQRKVNTRVNGLLKSEFWRKFSAGRQVYLMLVPVILYFLIFHYAPMYGVIIAFKEYNPLKGFYASKWIGFTHFIDFFNSYYFWRLLENTLMLSISNLVFGFPAPIILALMLNEVKSKVFKNSIQTISYLPHFVSLVVIVGIVMDFLSINGIFNTVLSYLGINKVQFMGEAGWFRSIYVASSIWQQVGWESIIYLSAMSSIDNELYEAAVVDGAGRFRQLINITLPCIAPTVIILLILGLGKIMNVGFEKVLLMQNSLNIETSEVIATFVYRRGLIDANYSYSTAVGLFNSVVNFILIISVNRMSRKLTETSLW